MAVTFDRYYCTCNGALFTVVREHYKRLIVTSAGERAFVETAICKRCLPFNAVLLQAETCCFPGDSSKLQVCQLVAGLSFNVHGTSR